MIVRDVFGTIVNLDTFKLVYIEAEDNDVRIIATNLNGGLHNLFIGNNRIQVEKVFDQLYYAWAKNVSLDLRDFITMKEGNNEQ